MTERTRVYEPRWPSRHDGLAGPLVAALATAGWGVAAGSLGGPPNLGTAFLLSILLTVERTYYLGLHPDVDALERDLAGVAA